MSKSQIKKMLVTFFSTKGVNQFEFILQGQTVNQESYMEIFKRLREIVHRKKPNFGPTIEFCTMTMILITRPSLSISGAKIDY
jgi:hypothetical protein